MTHACSSGPASVSELAQPLDMTLAAVVQHLQVLEASGLVRSQKIGRVRTCRIEPLALRQAEQGIAAPHHLGTPPRSAWRLSRRNVCRTRRKGVALA